MAGHNKWSKVKHKKAVTDAKKSKVYSKYSYLIATESRRVDGDVNSHTLRSLIEKAKAENVPIENIERAIAKGRAKSGGDVSMYEIYGPGGVGILAVTETDNKNRTVAELRHLVGKAGGSFANPGAVKWAFENKGGEWIPTTEVSVTKDCEGKLNNLIEAIEEHEDVSAVFTNKKV